MEGYKKRYRKALLALPYTTMKEMLSSYNEDDLFFCDINDPEHEDYEICQTVTEVIALKKNLIYAEIKICYLLYFTLTLKYFKKYSNRTIKKVIKKINSK